MTNDERLVLHGKVLEAVAGARYRVRTDDGRVVLVDLAEALAEDELRILAGDRVTVELAAVEPRSPTGLDGHILYRP